MVIRKNGFHPSQLPLAIVIPSDPSSWSSSQSHLVRLLYTPPFWPALICDCLGPRFALVGLWYLLTQRRGQTLPKFVAFWGVFRTLTCGGWTYVTSTDDHQWHDIFMISYLVATIPWTAGCLLLSPANPVAIRYRKYLAGAFFTTLVPLVYFFIQHKVHKVAGGTHYISHAVSHYHLSNRPHSLHYLRLL